MKITKPMRRDMIRRYLTDLRETTVSLAKRYRVTSSAVRYVFDQEGVPRRPRGWQPYPQTVTPGVAKIIRNRYQGGEAMTDLARSFGLTPDIVRTILVDGGVALRKRTVRRLFTPDEEAAIIAQYVVNQNITMQTIAEAHKVRKQDVWTVLKRHNIPTRAPGRTPGVSPWRRGFAIGTAER